jgi:outer membrane protein assembly factor BamB
MRHTVVRATLVLVATLALAGCWLQPGFDAEQSSYNGSENAVTPANVGGLHQLWSTALATTPVNDPVVSTNGVYASAGTSQTVGIVALLAAANGSVRWSQAPYTLVGPYTAMGPTLVGNNVDVPVYSYSPVVGSSIAVYDAATGTPGTSLSLSTSVPVVSRGSKLAGTFMQCTDTGLCGSWLFVHDSTGNGSWRTTLDITGWSGLPPVTRTAVGADHLFIGRGASVQSFPVAPPTNCTTTQGQTLCPPEWSTTVSTDVAGHPVLSPDDSVVYAAAGTKLVALRATDGAQLWSGTLGSNATAAPALANGRMYVPTGNGDLAVFAANGCGTSTCAPSWTDRTGSAINTTPAVVSGGVVYVASADGNLRAYAAAGCGTPTCTSALKTLATGSTVTGGPVAALGHVYVGTTDGHVLAYGL